MVKNKVNYPYLAKSRFYQRALQEKNRSKYNRQNKNNNQDNIVDLITGGFNIDYVKIILVVIGISIMIIGFFDLIKEPVKVAAKVAPLI